MKTSQEKFAPAFPGQTQKLALLSLLLVAVTLAVFWQAKHLGFVCYDDPNYFSTNKHVLGGLTGENIRWAFTTNTAENWHPLTWLSLMLDAQLSGDGPAGPHFVNVLFHIANTLLLFWLLRYLTTAVWRSFIVAALFAWHPLHVESVAWVAERKDVLCLFFELLSLLAYVRWVKERSETSPPARFYFLSLFLFALALLSKPMAVTLPVLLLLIDWWPLQRFAVKESVAGAVGLLWEKIPYFCLMCGACVVTFLVQQKGGAVMTLTRFSLASRVENAFVSYARYLGKMFWPSALAIPYPHPVTWPLALVILSVVLFVVLCFVALLLRRQYPFAFVGWFWFAITLVPVIGLVQVGEQSMADRYTYLPLIGIFMIVVWGGAAVCARWNIPMNAALGVAAMLLVACMVRTSQQITFWQNDETLFGHALAVTRNNYVASINYGNWMSKKGDNDEALKHYHAALEMCPTDPTALFDVANGLVKLGLVDEAITDYRLALQVTNQYDILCNLGYALAAKKDIDGAIANFAEAVRLKPDSAGAHNNLATMMFMENRYDEAAQHFRAASDLEPDNPQILVNLGDVLARLGQSKGAARCYQKALQLNPNDLRARSRLRVLIGP